MWVAKIRINGEKSLIGSRAKKFQVTVSGYPISIQRKKDGIYVYVAGFISGDERNKLNFIRDIKKDKRVIHLEYRNDFILAQIKEPLQAKIIYDSSLLHLEPLLIQKDGSEILTLGSWYKEVLITIVKFLERMYQGELIKVKQEKIKNISLVSVHPDLTIKQKKAIELALNHGYYNYPRGIELKKLARLMGLSYSTYQAHLRKAEQKLLPFFFEKIQ